MHFTRQFINVSLDGNRTYRAIDAFIRILFKELIGNTDVNYKRAESFHPHEDIYTYKLNHVSHRESRTKEKDSFYDELTADFEFGNRSLPLIRNSLCGIFLRTCCSNFNPLFFQSHIHDVTRGKQNNGPHD